MPKKNDPSYNSAIDWLFEKQAVVSFTRSDGVRNVAITVSRIDVHGLRESVTFQGIDLLDVIHRAKGVVWRREQWESWKKEGTDDLP